MRLLTFLLFSIFLVNAYADEPVPQNRCLLSAESEDAYVGSHLREIRLSPLEASTIVNKVMFEAALRRKASTMEAVRKALVFQGSALGQDGLSMDEWNHQFEIITISEEFLNGIVLNRLYPMLVVTSLNGLTNKAFGPNGPEFRQAECLLNTGRGHLVLSRASILIVRYIRAAINKDRKALYDATPAFVRGKFIETPSP